MKMASISPAVTPADAEQAALAQSDVLDAMKCLVRDGFDWRCVVAGASSAIADMVGSIDGPATVPAHFARLAELTSGMAGMQKH
jgi:hypothetical protein